MVKSYCEDSGTLDFIGFPERGIWFRLGDLFTFKPTKSVSDSDIPITFQFDPVRVSAKFYSKEPQLRPVTL